MDLRRQFFVLGSKLQGFKLETFIIVITNFLQKKLRKSNWNLFDFRSDMKSETDPLFLEADPDPHQNKADPKHSTHFN